MAGDGGEVEGGGMTTTNFDIYLEQQMKDPEFATRLTSASEAWDVEIQIAALQRICGIMVADDVVEYYAFEYRKPILHLTD